MNKEFMAKAATVEQAKEMALQQANADLTDTVFSEEYTVLETPKKKLFGGFKGEAVVKLTVTYEEKPVVIEPPAAATKLEIAKKYIDDILAAMDITDVLYTVAEDGDNVTITFTGDSIGVLIGHHGETLDALQYLVALASNRVDGNYYRITLDGGNYREKREETLRELAKKISEKVKRTGKSQMLEPMNPYERRIIHAVVSEIPGVFSKSKGEDPNRRVIIIGENTGRNTFNRNVRREGNYVKPEPKQTIEQMLKKDYEEKRKAQAANQVEDAEVTL